MMRRMVLSMLALLIAAGCATTTTIVEHGAGYRAHDLIEKDQVINTLNQLFIATDQKDWPRVTGLFAPKVRFDMTGKPQDLTPQQIIDAWDKGLKPLKAVHHQTGNYVVAVAGDQADVFCNGIAYHYLPTTSGKNIRTFVGSYDFHLMKRDGVWWIDQFKFNLKFMDGPPIQEVAE